MITGIAFTLGYLAMLVLAFTRHPIFGLYAYLAAFYAHPPSRWWGAGLPDLRWSMLAAVVAAIACMRLPADRTRTPWYKTGPGGILIAYVAWMWIQTGWAVDSSLHMEGTLLFTKYLLLYIIIYAICRSPEDMRRFLIAHVAGCFYLGWLAYSIKVKGRLEGVGGPGINDSNSLGMQLSTGIACGAALILTLQRWRQWALIGMMPFVVNGVILTASRGAFLNVLGAGFALWRLKPAAKKKFFYVLAALGLALVVVLGSELFWKRVFSIQAAATQSEELDKSAQSRTVFVKAQLEMFKDHPLGGGFSATLPLSPAYIPAEYLSKTESGQMARASHNSYMSILVDQGVVGAALFAALLFWCLRAFSRLKRGEYDGGSLDVGTIRAAVGAMLMGLAMHALFKNTLKAEVQIWCFALLASLYEYARQARAVAVPASQGRRVNATSRAKLAAGQKAHA